MLACLALLLASLWLARRLSQNPPYRRLAFSLAAVAVGGLFLHGFAIVATQVLGLGTVAIFAVLAIHRLAQDLLDLSPLQGALVTAIFLPFTLSAIPLMALAKGALGSLGLAPFPILLLGMAAVTQLRNLPLAGEFLLAGAGLAAAVVFRGLDRPLCAAVPTGTHFLYILLAGAVLLRLVAVTSRHALAAQG